MTTFNIDKTPTKYQEILISIIKHGRALKIIHNPQTWSLSALTFALHLYDCTVLFKRVRDKWKKQLPFSEAWDVDFFVWKNRIWSVVIDTNSFTSSDKYKEWKHLCDEDVSAFVVLANNCLKGNVPISDVLEFLKDKETELSEVILGMGQSLSEVLSEIDSIPTNAPKEKFIEYFDNLMAIYLRENKNNPYQVKQGEDIMTAEKWIASKTEGQRKKAISIKLNTINTILQKDSIWKEIWEENVSIDQMAIDKEGIGREIFAIRKNIVKNKIPCKESLKYFFSSLALCTHLWKYLISLSDYAFDNLPDSRKEIINSIELLAEKGVWASFTDAKQMKTFMRQVLGVGQQSLTENENRLSQILWSLFENRRGGEGLRVTWQNLIGYFDEKGLFTYTGGSPALNMMFFGDKEGSDNINKGRPGKPGMPKEFSDILPLLDSYCPQM